MSRLRDRVISQPAAATAAAMGSMHPAGTPDTPHVMPHVQVTYANASDGYTRTGVEQVMYAPNGAPVTGAAYGDVARAGRP